MTIDPMIFWTAMASIPGILALALQCYEKLTTKPKLMMNIRRSEVEMHLDNRGFLFFRGNIFLEIGNIGKELTTITQIEFRTDIGHRHAVSTFEGNPVAGATELGTVILQRSEAHLLRLHVWTSEEKD